MAKTRVSGGLTNDEIKERLLAGLVAELERDDDAPKPPDAPTIYFEEVEGSKYTHYFAVWHLFEYVDRAERCGVLMDALSAVDEEAALKASVVVGLTPDEASAMGFGG